jgi:hypothetical protein
MRVHAALGLRLQHAVIFLHPGAIPVHRQRATGIGDIDAVRAIAFHQFGLRRELCGGQHMAHHQKAGNVHAQAARIFDMLPGDIGLRTMGGDAD